MRPGRLASRQRRRQGQSRLREGRRSLMESSVEKCSLAQQEEKAQTASWKAMRGRAEWCSKWKRAKPEQPPRRLGERKPTSRAGGGRLKTDRKARVDPAARESSKAVTCRECSFLSPAERRTNGVGVGSQHLLRRLYGHGRRFGQGGLSDGSLEREQGGRQQARMMITDWARHEGNDFSMERSVSSSFQAVALCP